MLRVLCILLVAGHFAFSTTKLIPHNKKPLPVVTPSTASAPQTNTETPIPEDECGCSYDKIWLDIFLVVDSSSAMTNDGLQTLVNYLLTATGKMTVGQELEQVSRIGVITYDNETRLIYNLTDFHSATDMSSLFQLNYTGAFGSNIEAAIRLANDIFETSQHRPNAKKVIVLAASHYEPGTSIDPVQVAETFKGNGGTIITLEYVQTHGLEVPILKTLATSACYQLTNRNGTLGKNDLLDALCKANCFCQSNWFAYQNDTKCQTPKGGCFFPVSISSNQKLAERFCKNDLSGILPKITDLQKALFLAYLTPYQQPTWIGLEEYKNDLRWMDDSELGSFKPFGNRSATHACFVQELKGKSNVVWNSADCLKEDFLYSCQAMPCSTAKYCHHSDAVPSLIRHA